MIASSFLERLQKKRLLVKTRKRGMHKGSRQSSAFGSSLEFSDFRVYQPGDDVRQIDWNVYGRTQKHYIKRFLDEQEVAIAIYLDMSSSMRTYSEKWELARLCAAALSHIVLSSEDRLSFIPVTSTNMQPIRRKGAVYRKQVVHEIQRLEERESTTAFFAQLSQQILRNQQLAILLTDGLEPLDVIEAALKKLRLVKQEIWLFQLLAEEEMKPSYSGDVKLVDSESAGTVNVSMNPLLIENYQSRLNNHNQQLEAICRTLGCRYFLMNGEKDIQTILFHDLPRQGFMN